MNISYFISKRFSKARRNTKFVSVISSIAILGITIGVATLIIALSILNGFEKTLTKKITDFDSHIQVSSFTTELPNYSQSINFITNSLNSNLSSLNPYVSKLAIIGNRYRKEGVNVKGIKPSKKILGVSENIIYGSGNLNIKIALPPIIIGKKLADKLFVKLGDKVNLFALAKDKLPSAENPPNIKQFTVTGIYESGMAAFDDINVFTSIKDAQELFGFEDRINGIDIRVKDISKIDSLTEYLADNLRYPYFVRSIYQVHRNIFSWIELQKKPIPIILALIILVAVFNIIGTLLMMILEKTNSIGILKALGTRNKEIIMIFLFQGGFVASTGILAGNSLAFVLMFLQQKFNIITIPSSVYFMSTVPISMNIITFISVSLITLALALLASVIPSYIAAKTNPVKSLRFD